MTVAIGEAALLVGLLVCLAVVSGHPYSPYTDSKEDAAAKARADWSDEAVAAYLRNKMQKEDLRPSVLSEYILTLMQGGKKGPGGTVTVIVPTTTETPDTGKKVGPCLDSGTTKSLQREQLELVLDTVYPATGNPTPFTTLVTPDHGTTMYVDEVNPLNAYQVMLGEMGDTGHIWTSYSPCPQCVRALLNHYNKPEDEKPTIHVAGLYRESNSMTHIVQSLQCLGKLQYEGFSVVPWNFNDFKAPEGVLVFNENCTSDIDSYYGYVNFTSGYLELESQVTFVQQIGSQSHAGSWCTV